MKVIEKLESFLIRLLLIFLPLPQESIEVLPRIRKFLERWWRCQWERQMVEFGTRLRAYGQLDFTRLREFGFHRIGLEPDSEVEVGINVPEKRLRIEQVPQFLD